VILLTFDLGDIDVLQTFRGLVLMFKILNLVIPCSLQKKKNKKKLNFDL
jgi:hypothetical protein